MATESKNRLTILVEVFRSAICNREKVIIEIDILFIKAFYQMQMHLDRIAVECRQKLRRYEFVMKYNLKIIEVYPLRNLGRMGYYQKNVADKWHMPFNSP